MARKDITMTPQEQQTFLAEDHTLIVSTIGKDGSPHVAPMWYYLDDGKVAFRSFTKSQKIVNLRRDPRITVLAEDGTAYSKLRGLMIQGRAELSRDPDVVLSLYRELAAQYPMVDDQPLPDLTDEAATAAFGRFADKNTAVRVIPEHIVSWDHRKIGGGY